MGRASPRQTPAARAYRTAGMPPQCNPPLAKRFPVNEMGKVIDQAEALARILSSTGRLPTRDVPLADALGGFAARDLLARLAMPPFDNSAMDGYAVVASSCAIGRRLRVTGEQPAGADRGLTMTAGQAIRIFTGAPLPRGADAVIMQEDVTREADEILLHADVASGESVRRCGGDVAAGQKILTAGERIRPQTLALLAAQGFASVEIGGDVTATILATGDELKPPGTDLQPGEIFESNTTLLRALLAELGVRMVSVVHCQDDGESIEQAIRAATACDILIISGGVSVGARDLVKPALAAAGAQLELWRVAVKPGKPFLFGRSDKCAIFGLPGNPVSAFVTFLLFVRPAVLKLMGADGDGLQLPAVPARLAHAMRNDGDRPHYIRGRVDRGVFTPFGRQESHALFGLSRSNGLLLLGPGEQVEALQEASIFVWD